MSLQNINAYTYSPGFQLGQYHNAVLCISGNVQSLYLDGNLIATKTGTSNVLANYSTINQILVGCAGDKSSGFSGYLDDFRMYNYTLNQSQVSNLYVNRNIVAYYPFDNSLNSQTPNYVTLNYDANLVGSSTTISTSTYQVGNGSLQLTNSSSASPNYITSSSAFSTSATNGLSVSLWFKTTGVSSTRMRLFDLCSALGSQGISVDINGTNQILAGNGIYIPPVPVEPVVPPVITPSFQNIYDDLTNVSSIIYQNSVPQVNPSANPNAIYYIGITTKNDTYIAPNSMFTSSGNTWYLSNNNSFQYATIHSNTDVLGQENSYYFNNTPMQYLSTNSRVFSIFYLSNGPTPIANIYRNINITTAGTYTVSFATSFHDRSLGNNNQPFFNMKIALGSSYITFNNTNTTYASSGNVTLSAYSKNSAGTSATSTLMQNNPAINALVGSLVFITLTFTNVSVGTNVLSFGADTVNTGQNGFGISEIGVNYVAEVATTTPVTGVIDALSSTTKTAMLYSGAGASLSAGAFGVKLLYGAYTGPVITIRRSSDSVTANFYADISGNLGTTVGGTGTSLSSWLSSATAYVTKWWDQTGNSNHATQTNTGKQPTLNTTTKKIVFTARSHSDFDYLDLPDGSCPYGNTNYTYIVKFSTTNYYGFVVGCGPNPAVAGSTTSGGYAIGRNNTSGYQDNWWTSNFINPTGYEDNNVVGNMYNGSTRYITANGNLLGSQAASGRNQVSNYNAIGTYGGHYQAIGQNADGTSGGTGTVEFLYIIPLYLENSNADKVLLESTTTYAPIPYTITQYTTDFTTAPSGHITNGTIFDGWTATVPTNTTLYSGSNFYGTTHMDPTQSPSASGRNLNFTIHTGALQLSISRSIYLYANYTYTLSFFIGTRTGQYYNSNNYFKGTVTNGTSNSTPNPIFNITGMISTETKKTYTFTVPTSSNYTFSFISGSDVSVADTTYILRNVSITDSAPGLPSGYLYYFKFRGDAVNSGSLSSSIPNALLSGSTPNPNGTIGGKTCLSITTQGDYVYFPAFGSTPTTPPPLNFSFGFWFYNPNFVAPYGFETNSIADKTFSGNNSTIWQGDINSDGYQTPIAANTYWNVVLNSFYNSTNAWVHIFYTVTNATTFTVYVNGVSTKTASTGVGSFLTLSNYYHILGRQGDGNLRTINGCGLREFLHYNRTLTATEVNTIYSLTA